MTDPSNADVLQGLSRSWRDALASPPPPPVAPTTEPDADEPVETPRPEEPPADHKTTTPRVTRTTAKADRKTPPG